MPIKNGKLSAMKSRTVSKIVATKNKVGKANGMSFVKKASVLVIIALTGGIIGATTGISNERDRNMETYSHQSYNAGVIDGKKLWYASIVKANERIPTNNSQIVIPVEGKVTRTNGLLTCRSIYTSRDDNEYKFAPDEAFNCNKKLHTSREFVIGELEKVVPEGGSIERISETEYKCSTESLFRHQATLEECTYLLRMGLHEEYNKFILQNYSETEANPLYVEAPKGMVKIIKSEPAIENGKGGTLSGSEAGESVSGGALETPPPAEKK